MKMLTYKDISTGELFLQLGGRGCYIYRYINYLFDSASYKKPKADIVCDNIDEVMSHCSSKFSKIQPDNYVKMATLCFEDKTDQDNYIAERYIKVNDYQLMVLHGNYDDEDSDLYHFDHDITINNNLHPKFVDINMPELALTDILLPFRLTRDTPNNGDDIKMLITPINDSKKNKGAVVRLKVRDRESCGYYVSSVEFAKMLYTIASNDIWMCNIVIEKSPEYSLIDSYESIKYLKERLNKPYSNDFRKIKFIKFSDDYVGIEFFGLMDIFRPWVITYKRFLPSGMYEVIKAK